jgi:hypothetical protein
MMSCGEIRQTSEAALETSAAGHLLHDLLHCVEMSRFCYVTHVQILTRLLAVVIRHDAQLTCTKVLAAAWSDQPKLPVRPMGILIHGKSGKTTL